MANKDGLKKINVHEHWVEVVFEVCFFDQVAFRVMISVPFIPTNPLTDSVYTLS